MFEVGQGLKKIQAQQQAISVRNHSVTFCLANNPETPGQPKPTVDHATTSSTFCKAKSVGDVSSSESSASSWEFSAITRWKLDF